MRTSLNFLIAVLMGIFTLAQNLPNAQLPPPGQFNWNYLHSLGQRNILWGATPPNFNGKVILFNHGYILSTETMLIGNTMYENAYNAGYKTAFVATTRGEGCWVNGEILSRAMDQVAYHYGVNDFDMVVHSNGGKASEVAMFHYGKRDRAKKVITLGTPYRGTQLANISQMWWFNWLWRLTGLNEGAATSTTYYCDYYLRPYFDNHSLNQPWKFYNYGAWGKYHGRTIFSPLMHVGGFFISLFGGGPNDGVTPYYSSTRPGGNRLFSLWDANGMYDHMDILYGQFTWNRFYPYLNASPRPSANAMPDNNNEDNFEEENSNYQVVSSDNGYDELWIEKDAKKIELAIFHEETNAEFSIIDVASGKTLAQFKSDASATYELEQHTTSYVFENPGVDRIKIVGNTKFGAGATYDSENQLKYSYDKSKGAIKVKAPENMDDDLQVHAIFDLTNQLDGSETKKGKTTAIKLKKEGDFFMADVSDLPNGVYSMFITAESGYHNFKRNLVSGFVIGDDVPAIENNIEVIREPIKPIFSLSENPVNAHTFLISSDREISDVSISIMDINGNVRHRFNAKNADGKISFGAQIQNLPRGNYIASVSANGIQTNLKFIK